MMMFVKFNPCLIVIFHFHSIYRLQFNQKSLKFYNIYKITLCVWKVIVYQRKIKYRRRRHGRGKTLKRSFFGTNSFLSLWYSKNNIARKTFQFGRWKRSTWMLKNIFQAVVMTKISTHIIFLSLFKRFVRRWMYICQVWLSVTSSVWLFTLFCYNLILLRYEELK